MNLSYRILCVVHVCDAVRRLATEVAHFSEDPRYHRRRNVVTAHLTPSLVKPYKRILYSNVILDAAPTSLLLAFQRPRVTTEVGLDGSFCSRKVILIPEFRLGDRQEELSLLAW